MSPARMPVIRTLALVSDGGSRKNSLTSKGKSKWTSSRGWAIGAHVQPGHQGRRGRAQLRRRMRIAAKAPEIQERSGGFSISVHRAGRILGEVEGGKVDHLGAGHACAEQGQHYGECQLAQQRHE